MHIKRGIAVSPGVAIGPAMVFGTESFRIPQQLISANAVDMELARFHAALDATCQEIQLNEQLARELGEQYAAIFSAHLLLARDQQLLSQIEERIRQKNSPEFAASQVLRQYAKRLRDLGGQYLAERSIDIYDLEKRLLRHLLEQPAAWEYVSFDRNEDAPPFLAWQPQAA